MNNQEYTNKKLQFKLAEQQEIIRQASLSREEKIQEQIAMAQKILNKSPLDVNWECVIVSFKSSLKAKKEFFGFRFERVGTFKLGETYQKDSSFVTIEHIL